MVFRPSLIFLDTMANDPLFVVCLLVIPTHYPCFYNCTWGACASFRMGGVCIDTRIPCPGITRCPYHPINILVSIFVHWAVAHSSASFPAGGCADACIPCVFLTPFSPPPGQALILGTMTKLRSRPDLPACGGAFGRRRWDSPLAPLRPGTVSQDTGHGLSGARTTPPPTQHSTTQHTTAPHSVPRTRGSHCLAPHTFSRR